MHDAHTPVVHLLLGEEHGAVAAGVAGKQQREHAAVAAVALPRDALGELSRPVEDVVALQTGIAKQDTGLLGAVLIAGADMRFLKLGAKSSSLTLHMLHGGVSYPLLQPSSGMSAVRCRLQQYHPG